MRHPSLGTRIRTAIAVLLALVLVGGTAACSFASPSDSVTPSDAGTTPEETIDVVASLSQWGSLARRIGGDAVTVTSIISSDTADPHDFTPTAQDVEKLDHAAIVLANGAGYDTWATEHVPQGATLISVAQVVGAMDGDNPHLWFSKDARFAAAEELSEAFTRAAPSHRKEFESNLAAWKEREEALEQRMHRFAGEHAGLSYAAAEDVAYYLMSDMGFQDATPSAYRKAAAAGTEPGEDAMRAFEDLLKEGGTTLLVSTDTPSPATLDALREAADRGGVPALDVTEQMPADCKDLTDWIAQLFDQASGKVGDREQEVSRQTPDATPTAGEEASTGQS